ncbi:Six-hairpin glycosidase [Thozetella sp. PMI_491]|nr:Six-hairpin glycosidase [Thozetella sp. PMI_491]
MSLQPFASKEARWIWASPIPGDDPEPGQFVLFRRSFLLEDVVSPQCLVHISADTRYRLYVNGWRASFGPCKSYATRWYYETVDIAPFLKQGKNCLAVKVMRLPSSSPAGLSMARSCLPGLIVHCKIRDMALHTDENWKVQRDASVQLVPSKEWDFRLGPPLLSLWERVDGRLSHFGWQETEFDDSQWSPAAQRTMEMMMSPILDPRNLTPRSIPQLPEVAACFDKALHCEGCENINTEDFSKLLLSKHPVRIEAQANIIVEIEAATLATGFLELSCFQDGDGSATISILTAECYEGDMSHGQARSKGHRGYSPAGKLNGATDTYVCRPGENYYEPFWWRTFRYVQLRIQTTNSPVTLQSLQYRSTNYPLHIETTLASTPFVDDLWRVSLNTLKNCMHETFEDCPYYEQNQFAMDSRSQILFNYLLSSDDRLARKTIHEFHASRRDDGLLEAHFPSSARMTNIPQFSLFWVAMVHDHMQKFWDLRMVRTYLGTIDGVLGHFADRLNHLGLVGRFDDEAWAFVDWVDEWKTPSKGFKGMALPPAYHAVGAATINSLLYAVALLQAADLNDFVGRASTAEEYRRRAQDLNSAVRHHCFEPTSGLFLDGPGFKQVSQHTQVFAVLSGAVSGNEARLLMLKAVKQCEELQLAKASLAMSFYVFRAAARAGAYEELWEALIQPWRNMLGQDLTTWAEFENNPRSDCHGWSAVPVYEIVREIVGLRTSSTKGDGPIILQPRVSLVEHLGGTFAIDDDRTLEVSWKHGQIIELRSDSDAVVELRIGSATRRIVLRKGVSTTTAVDSVSPSWGQHLVDLVASALKALGLKSSH